MPLTQDFNLKEIFPSLRKLIKKRILILVIGVKSISWIATQEHLRALKSLVIRDHRISPVVTNTMTLLHIQFTKLKPQNLSCKGEEVFFFNQKKTEHYVFV